MAKIINKFNIDLSDMAAAGGSRTFSIEGDAGAIFSLEVKNEDGYYYNFSTETFSATKSKLKQQVIGTTGRYTNNILFPIITDNDQYDIYLWAEQAYDTEHIQFLEVRFGDDSLDINSSTGSNSSLVQKVIYQYTDTTITIVPFMQTQSGNLVEWLDSYVADTIIVGRGKNSGKQSFSCTVSCGATEGLQILRQPLAGDFFTEIDVKIESYAASSGAVLTGGGPVLIQGEDIWAEAKSRSSGVVDGHTRGSSTINGDFSGGATKIIVDALPSHTQVGDRVTGFTVSTVVNSLLGTASAANTSVVLITAINPDGDNANEFSVDTTIVIADGATMYFNAPYYYRYKTDSSLAASSSGVLGLKLGLKEV